MPLVVPFIIAAVFTGGFIVIQQLERHAEKVTEVLSLALFVMVLFVVAGLFASQMRSIEGEDQENVILWYKAQSRSISEGPVMDFGSD